MVYNHIASIWELMSPIQLFFVNMNIYLIEVVILDYIVSWYGGLHLQGNNPYCKVHGTNMGTTWDRQDPDGPHVGHINIASWFNYSKNGLYKNGFKQLGIAYKFIIKMPIPVICFIIFSSQYTPSVIVLAKYDSLFVGMSTRYLLSYNRQCLYIYSNPMTFIALWHYNCIP